MMSEVAHPRRTGTTSTTPAAHPSESTFLVPALFPAAGQAGKYGSALALLLMEALHAVPGVHRIRVDRASARVCVGYRCGTLSADDLQAHLNLAGFVVDSAAAAS